MEPNDLTDLFVEDMISDYHNDEYTYHVKFLCYCRHKLINQDSRDVLRKPSVMIGTIIDNYYKDLIRRNYNLDKPPAEHVEVDQYTLIGTPDAKDGDQIIDFKFSVFPPKEPKPHDVMQAELYGFTYSIDYTELWYLSPLADDWIKFKVPSDVLDVDGVLDLIENPRYPMWDFECIGKKGKINCPFYPCPHVGIDDDQII